jgi:hypothetical protein
MKNPITNSMLGQARLALLGGIILLPLVIGRSAEGQDYTVNWHKIAGGGGSSSGTNGGNPFSVTGTVGQPDAGVALSGGSFSLSGGFWSFISPVQTTGAPALVITHSGQGVIISWPDLGAYTLQQNTTLANPAGWTASNYAITTANGTNSISIPPARGNVFFRLASP